MNRKSKQYVVIHGLAPSHLMGKGDESDAVLREYIAGIVYGSPERIYGTLLATGKFAALVVWDLDTEHIGGAAHTVDRMSSFSYGAAFTQDTDIAWREFGCWVGHYSGCSYRD